MRRFLSLSKVKMVMLVLVLGYMFILFPQQSAAQAIDIDPNSWDFGDVLLGSSETKVFNVECASDTMVYIEEIGLTEYNPLVGMLEQETSFFSIVSAPDLPLFLDPDPNTPDPYMIDIDISFAPTAVGFYDAFLFISSNAPQERDYIPLQGRGVTIPEPSICILLFFGLVGLVGFKKKFRT